jgi:hypothetical protein
LLQGSGREITAAKKIDMLQIAQDRRRKETKFSRRETKKERDVDTTAGTRWNSTLVADEIMMVLGEP